MQWERLEIFPQDLERMAPKGFAGSPFCPGRKDAETVSSIPPLDRAKLVLEARSSCSGRDPAPRGGLIVQSTGWLAPWLRISSASGSPWQGQGAQIERARQSASNREGSRGAGDALSRSSTKGELPLAASACP